HQPGQREQPSVYDNRHHNAVHTCRRRHCNPQHHIRASDSHKLLRYRERHLRFNELTSQHRAFRNGNPTTGGSALSESSQRKLRQHKRRNHGNPDDPTDEQRKYERDDQSGKRHWNWILGEWLVDSVYISGGWYDIIEGELLAHFRRKLYRNSFDCQQRRQFSNDDRALRHRSDVHLWISSPVRTKQRQSSPPSAELRYVHPTACRPIVC